MLLGFVSSAVLAALNDRRVVRQRWTLPAMELFASYGAVTRSLRDSARTLSETSRSGDIDQLAEVRDRFAEQRQDLRTLFERLALVGEPEVIVHAREIRRYVHRLHQLAAAGEDPKGEPWLEIESTLRSSQRKFYVAARRQLAVPSGDDPGPGVDE